MYQKQIFDYQLIGTAWHEASHTICALYNYLYVSDVSLTSGKYDGDVSWFVYADIHLIEDLELRNALLMGELQTFYAGLVGDKTFYKNASGSPSLPIHFRIGSSYDIEQASLRIRKYKLSEPGKETYLFKKQIQNDVETILIEHWDAIRIIAHSLYKEKKLSFEEIKFLLTRKIKNKAFWKDKFKKIKMLYDDSNPPNEYNIKSIVLNK